MLSPPPGRKPAARFHNGCSRFPGKKSIPRKASSSPFPSWFLCPAISSTRKPSGKIGSGSESAMHEGTRVPNPGNKNSWERGESLKGASLMIPFLSKSFAPGTATLPLCGAAIWEAAERERRVIPGKKNPFFWLRFPRAGGGRSMVARALGTGPAGLQPGFRFPGRLREFRALLGFWRLLEEKEGTTQHFFTGEYSWGEDTQSLRVSTNPDGSFRNPAVPLDWGCPVLFLRAGSVHVPPNPIPPLLSLQLAHAHPGIFSKPGWNISGTNLLNPDPTNLRSSLQ